MALAKQKAYLTSVNNQVTIEFVVMLNTMEVRFPMPPLGLLDLIDWRLWSVLT